MLRVFRTQKPASPIPVFSSWPCSFVPTARCRLETGSEKAVFQTGKKRREKRGRGICIERDLVEFLFRLFFLSTNFYNFFERAFAHIGEKYSCCFNCLLLFYTLFRLFVFFLNYFSEKNNFQYSSTFFTSNTVHMHLFFNILLLLLTPGAQKCL